MSGRRSIEAFQAISTRNKPQMPAPAKENTERMETGPIPAEGREQAQGGSRREPSPAQIEPRVRASLPQQLEVPNLSPHALAVSSDLAEPVRRRTVESEALLEAPDDPRMPAHPQELAGPPQRKGNEYSHPATKAPPAAGPISPFLPILRPRRQRIGYPTLKAAHTPLESQQGVETRAGQSKTVHVNIGRIEVRAAAPSPNQIVEPTRAPLLSLDAYLHKRTGEGSE
jgi:hypothetical protein